MFLWCVRDGWRDIYKERGILLPISSSRSQRVPTLVPPCKLVGDAPARLRVPRLTAIICALSKSDHMVLIMWSLSGFTPVRPKWSDALLSSCLLIKMWQLAKAHGITRNKPKIHIICYITHFATFDYYVVILFLQLHWVIMWFFLFMLKCVNDIIHTEFSNLNQNNEAVLYSKQLQYMHENL